MNGKDLEMYYQKYSAGREEEIHHYHHYDTQPSSNCINDSRIKILENLVLKLSTELEDCKKIIQEQNKRITDLVSNIVVLEYQNRMYTNS